MSVKRLKSAEEELLQKQLSTATTVSDSNSDDSTTVQRDRCGVFSCRPDAIQCFASLPVFTAAVSLWTLVVSLHFSVYSAVLVNIEKAFGLSSTMVGIIKNVDNIGYVVAVIITAQVCRYVNKPRLFGVASIANAISVAMFAVPHFLQDHSQTYVNHTAHNFTAFDQDQQLCADENRYQCKGSDSDGTFNTAATVIFFVSTLFQGASGSPKFTMSLTYMDDNDAEKSPLYFAFIMATKALSPLIGYLIGAMTNRIHVDLQDPGYEPDDPRYIGAWWVGFLICAFMNLLIAIPISMFPANIKPKPKRNKQESNDVTNNNVKVIEKEQEAAPQLKAPTLAEIPSAVKRIMSDFLFVMLLVASCLEIYMFGFLTFTPKYLQYQFGVTPVMSSIYTGVVMCVALCIGPILSGYITTRASVSIGVSLRLIVTVGALSSVGILLLMYPHCPEQWAGDLGPHRTSLNSTCNMDCGCEPGYFLPVCGDDNRNYFSSCYAGCTQSNTTRDGLQTYSNCSCVPGGGAVQGKCHKQCWSQWLYLAVLCCVTFVSSMDLVPKLNIIVRKSTGKDKSMAIALFGAIMMLFGVPSPMVFGMVIDTTCVTNLELCGERGACKLYDMSYFRFRVHGFAFVLKFTATCIYVAGYIINTYLNQRRAKYAKEHGDDVAGGAARKLVDGSGKHQAEDKVGEDDDQMVDVSKSVSNLRKASLFSSSHIIWDLQTVRALLDDNAEDLRESTI